MLPGPARRSSLCANSDPLEEATLGTLKSNLSRFDRVLRLTLGLACVAAALQGGLSGHADLALLLFGWVPIVTGIAGWCPLYVLFGVSTRRG